MNRMQEYLFVGKKPVGLHRIINAEGTCLLTVWSQLDSQPLVQIETDKTGKWILRRGSILDIHVLKAVLGIEIGTGLSWGAAH